MKITCIIRSALEDTETLDLYGFLRFVGACIIRSALEDTETPTRLAIASAILILHYSIRS